MRKRWRVALMGVLMQLCLGTVYAWSIFKKPMMASNGWGETQTQLAFMIYGAVFALAVAFGGTLVDRVGPRIIALLGGTLFSAGVFLGGLANQLQRIELLILAYGLVGGLGGGFGYVTPIATLIRWFPDKRGLVTGLAVMGYGLGAFIMGNIGPSLIMSLGIAKTFYLWGGISLVIITGSALALENPPGGWHQLIARPGGIPSPAAERCATFPEALSSGRFWILWTMLFLSITAGLGLISQLSPMAQDVMMRSPAGVMNEEQMKAIVLASGTIVAVAGLFNGLGRLAWAWFSDTIGRKAVFAIIFTSFVLGFAALAHVETIIIFAALTFYLLACYGGTMASMPALAADEFGHEHIGKIYGMIFTASGFGSMCGPYIFARVKELTGDFTYALYAESTLAAMGLVLVAVLKKAPKANRY
ncbi:MAG TPA: OFA family MFS transporter [Desulfomonilia bacterium]|nr:OFA family MFS transporter [Thermodesulfobacteriota bacterium]HWR69259.1 OFA family MFS transporter [Desulfomonilia bacterium]